MFYKLLGLTVILMLADINPIPHQGETNHIEAVMDQFFHKIGSVEKTPSGIKSNNFLLIK